MDKIQIDELYHNLRELYVTNDVLQKEAIEGLITHLSKPSGNYDGLLRYLNYYGEKYTLPSVLIFMQRLAFPHKTNQYTRVVELGAGTGWLGRGLAKAFNVPVLLVDKRQFYCIDIVADIEAVNGRKRVLDALLPGDLIVASELLHCLDNPEKVMESFTKYDILAVEYWPEKNSYRISYNKQISSLGCTPVRSVRDIFPRSRIESSANDTHIFWMIRPLEGGHINDSK